MENELIQTQFGKVHPMQIQGALETTQIQRRLETKNIRKHKTKSLNLS